MCVCVYSVFKIVCVLMYMYTRACAHMYVNCYFVVMYLHLCVSVYNASY